MSEGERMSMFQQERARLNVVRYEELDRLFHEIFTEDKDFRASVREEGEPLWLNKADEPLTQAECWSRGMEVAMDIIDRRLNELSAD